MASSKVFIAVFEPSVLRQKSSFRSEARVVVEDYRRVYNQQRPHSSLGYKTPDEFAQALNYQPAETRPTHM